MNTLTKNRQTPEILDRIVRQAFGGTDMEHVEELTDGSFNAAYIVTLTDKTQAVLKIAPPPGSLIAAYEKNIMFSEVDSMRMVTQMTDLPVAEILYYDNSCSLVSSEYFFMKKLTGKSLDTQLKNLSDEEIIKIRETVGRYTAKLNTLTNGKFGYYGQKDKQGTYWPDVFRNMLADAVKDAAALNIDIKIDTVQLFGLLERDTAYFKEVTVPQFVHWDLWDGNVFVENGRVTGLIDFERCLWADALMELGFRAHRVNEHFLRGYGITEFSRSQMARAQWYDVYLFLLKLLETDYRGYEDREYHNYAAQRIVGYVENIVNQL